MTFTIQGQFSNDGAWGLQAIVPNGETVTHGDVVRLLALAMEQLTRNPATRLPTIAEESAMREEYARTCALPDGWEPTADGVSQTHDLGANTVVFSRTYQHGERVVTAPCAADGSAIPATRSTLLEA